MPFLLLFLSPQPNWFRIRILAWILRHRGPNFGLYKLVTYYSNVLACVSLIGHTARKKTNVADLFGTFFFPKRK